MIKVNHSNSTNDNKKPSQDSICPLFLIVPVNGLVGNDCGNCLSTLLSTKFKSNAVDVIVAKGNFILLMKNT